MIEFHDGTHVQLASYTGGRAWNDAELLGHPGGRMHNWNNNETVIRNLLNASARQVGAFVISAIAKHDTETLWVIKGFHQGLNPTNAMMQQCHITLSLRGTTYHLDCWFTGTQMPVISNVTQGAQHKVDLDGFTTPNRKGR